jgi:hypothetical protein
MTGHRNIFYSINQNDYNSEEDLWKNGMLNAAGQGESICVPWNDAENKGLHKLYSYSSFLTWAERLYTMAASSLFWFLPVL